MSFELTINRIGFLCSDAPGLDFERSNVVETFRDQIFSIYQDKEFRDSLTEIIASLPSCQLLDPIIKRGSEQGVVRIRRLATQDNKPDSTLVGTMPGLRFRCRLASSSDRLREWIVSARPSATSCALQKDNKYTKLWWTFEGVPADEDPSNRPSVEDAQTFIDFTDKVAEQLVIPFFGSYCSSLDKLITNGSSQLSLRSSRLRVRMSDSCDYELQAFLDAIHYGHLQTSDIRNSESLQAAKKGLELFERFAIEATKQKLAHIPDQSLGVDTTFEGLKALVLGPIVDHDEIIVAGIGQQSGSLLGLESAVAPEKRLRETSETNLRATSASRPISAAIADREAAKWGLVA